MTKSSSRCRDSGISHGPSARLVNPCSQFFSPCGSGLTMSTEQLCFLLQLFFNKSLLDCRRLMPPPPPKLLAGMTCVVVEECQRLDNETRAANDIGEARSRGDGCWPTAASQSVAAIKALGQRGAGIACPTAAPGSRGQQRRMPGMWAKLGRVWADLLIQTCVWK